MSAPTTAELRDAKKDLDRHHRAVAAIKPHLAGLPPAMQGSVLAELLAIWLRGHRASTAIATAAVHDAMLEFHIETVRKLVAL